MFKRKQIEGMERKTLEDSFMEIQALLGKVADEKETETQTKEKILLIAKPFFDAFNNMDLSHAKEMGKIEIGFLVTDIYKLVNEDDEEDTGGKGNWFKSVFETKADKPEKKPKDYKQVVIKIANKLAEYGINVPVSKPLETTEDDLVFIKNQIEKL